MSKDYKNEIKIYYEDTDAGGVVYYSNYLKFLERARTEMLGSIGLSNKKLLEEHNTLIIVKSCNIEYIAPARLEDKIQISNLNFEYVENFPVLNDISINIKKGETSAIVGSTGSGKSTLIKLLLRLSLK